MQHLLKCFLFLFLISPLLPAQQASRVKMADLENRMKPSDTLYIVNFWATWCGPCVAELPEFNRIDSAWKGKPVRILLVSMDFPEDFPLKLNAFLQKTKLQPMVLWLDESNPNTFMPKVSANWGGGLPASWIVYKAKNYNEFHEGKITYEFLDEKIRQNLKKD